MTDPIGTAQERELIERARLEAKRESEVSRMRAQSKSLRQAGHEPPRDDLYMWSKPEQTNTWKLADALQSRIAEVGRLRDAIEALGVMPEGYCFCSKDRIGDDSKVHEPECADLRATLSLQRRV